MPQLSKTFLTEICEFIFRLSLVSKINISSDENHTPFLKYFFTFVVEIKKHKSIKMNLIAPVSRIMSTKLVTLGIDDHLEEVKKLFDTHNFHHIPIIDEDHKLLGIVSKQDFLYFLHGFTNEPVSGTAADLLKNTTVEKIMTTGLAKLEPGTRVNVALEVFKENLFHALPVVDGDQLVGIITTYDIIRAIAEDPIALEDYSK